VQQHATITDRHDIMAIIKRRFGTLKAFAEQKTTLSASEVSAALAAPYPKAETIIAKALGMPVQTLWPDRYWPNGRRRLPSSRPRLSLASQNRSPVVDKEGGE
jgi:Ner family transcriptional regulator